jgi:hypothetical protein
MPPLLEDPRIRQTWNQFSSNAESATESAAAGIWTFTHAYVNPCLSSVSSSLNQCTGHCFPDRDERARRRERGRAEFSFDFYDDWDEEEGSGSGNGGILGWGNDELDRLLAGSGAHGGEVQPVGRKRGMSYGTRNPPRRRGTIDGLPDPTIIPSTNLLGFLGRLPWKLGKTLRYKPSAADLQDQPRQRTESRVVEEAEPLMEEETDEALKGHTRQRSSTASSGETTDSFRSRGDLFPSDEEDAVPLSDEFAMALERRNTGSGMDDRSSGKTKSSKGKRPAGSRTTSRTKSRTISDSMRPSLVRKRVSSTPSPHEPSYPEAVVIDTPSMMDLQQEEERIKSEEEQEVARKRQAAAKLAAERGLSITDDARKAIITGDETFPADDITSTPDIDHEGYNTSKDNAANSGENVTASQEFVPARLPHF